MPEPNRPWNNWRSETPCAVDGCDLGLHAKGYCRLHYGRWRKSGDPLVIAGRPTRSSFKERFFLTGWDVLESGCWKWRGRLGEFGYGRIRHEGRYTTAHRASYMLQVGEIPDGLWIRHTCDNGYCVNPDHLIPGTAQQNMDDQIERGRKAVGEQVGNSRFKAEQVIEMRERRAEGEKLASLAESFDTSTSVISSICTRRSWKWLPPSPRELAAA